MRNADGDLRQSDKLIPAPDIPYVFGKADGTDFLIIFVVDDGSGDRNWNYLAFFVLNLVSKLLILPLPSPGLPRIAAMTRRASFNVG